MLDEPFIHDLGVKDWENDEQAENLAAGAFTNLGAWWSSAPAEGAPAAQSPEQNKEDASLDSADGSGVLGIISTISSAFYNKTRLEQDTVPTAPEPEERDRIRFAVRNFRYTQQHVYYPYRGGDTLPESNPRLEESKPLRKAYSGGDPEPIETVEALMAKKQSVDNFKQQNFKNQLKYLDYGSQSLDICGTKKSRDSYVERMISDQKTYYRLNEFLEEYNAGIARNFVENKDQDIKTNLKMLFENDNMLNDKGEHERASSLILDIVSYHLENFQISKLLKFMDFLNKETGVWSKMPEEYRKKVLMRIAPTMKRLGRDFMNHKELNSLKEKTSNNLLCNILFAAANDSVTKYMSEEQNLNKVVSDFESDLDIFVFHVLASEKEQILTRDKDSKNNIMHMLIEKIMKMDIPEPSAGDGVRENSIVQLELYRKHFIALCENLPTDVFSDLMNQHNRDGYTPVQLFYKLAAADKKKETHLVNENGIFLFGTILKYCGQVDLAAGNNFNTAITWFLHFVSSMMIGKFFNIVLIRPIMSLLSYPVYWSTGNSIGANTLGALSSVAVESMFITSLSPIYKDAEEKLKKDLKAGYAQRFCPNFEKTTVLSGVMNPGFKYGYSRVVDRDRVSAQLGAASESLIGTKRCFTSGENFHNMQSNISTMEKIEIYQTLIRRKKLLEYKLQSYQEKTFWESIKSFGSIYEALLHFFIIDEKTKLKIEIGKVKRDIDAVAVNLGSSRELGDFMKRIKQYKSIGHSGPLYPIINSCLSDADRIKIAEELLKNKEGAADAFERLYLMFNKGIIPLKSDEYDNAERMFKIFKEMRTSWAKKEGEDQIKKKLSIKYKEPRKYDASANHAEIDAKLDAKIKSMPQDLINLVERDIFTFRFAEYTTPEGAKDMTGESLAQYTPQGAADKMIRQQRKERVENFNGLLRRYNGLKYTEESKITPLVVKQSFLDTIANFGEKIGIGREWLLDCYIKIRATIPSGRQLGVVFGVNVLMGMLSGLLTGGAKTVADSFFSIGNMQTNMTDNSMKAVASQLPPGHTLSITAPK